METINYFTSRYVERSAVVKDMCGAVLQPTTKLFQHKGSCCFFASLFLQVLLFEHGLLVLRLNKQTG